MANSGNTRGSPRTAAGSVLTQKDADRFKKSAKKYAATATTSKETARKKLVALGTHTPTGRLTKKYG